VVDDRLEGGDHLGRDQRHARLQLRPVLGGGGQFGAGHEQFPLEADQQFAQFGAGLGLGPGQAEGGHRLVDLAVGRGAGGVLPDPAAVAQAGRAVVALPCVDLHEDGESTTPSELSWMLRYPEPTMGRFLDTLRERIVVFDGATGTNLQQRDLGADDFGGPALEGCNEILAVTRPAVIADLHRSFFEVGVDAVETDTFGAFPVVLAEYGIAGRTFELNRAAARIAKEVASGYSTPDRPRWVIGSIGPGTKLPSLGQIDFVTLRDGYETQVAGLLAGGADVLLVETVYDLLQAKAAIVAARRAMAKAGTAVPLMVQVTMETTGRMLVGSEIGAALTALEALRPDVIGLNCATGPREMTEHLRHLSRHARTFLSCLPNAGL